MLLCTDRMKQHGSDPSAFTYQSCFGPIKVTQPTVLSGTNIELGEWVLNQMIQGTAQV